MGFKGEVGWVGCGVCERREVASRSENRSRPIPFVGMLRAGSTCVVVRLRVYEGTASAAPSNYRQLHSFFLPISIPNWRFSSLT